MADARPGKVPASDTIKREESALELKRAGVTYETIADRLGFANRGSAYRAVQRALTRTMQEPADELRTIEADRLDRLLFAIWQKALGGDLGAVDRVLRLMERRAKLLGLDVAIDRGGFGSAGSYDAQIEELLAEVRVQPGGRGPAHPG